MRTESKALLLRVSGLLFSTVPVIVSIISFFPVWRQKGAGTLFSGFTLLLLLLAFVPFFRVVKKWLTSPSAVTMWFIIFISFFMLSRIADEMTVIAFIGFIGNLIGSLFWRLARKINNERQI